MSRQTHHRAGSLKFQVNQLFAAAHAIGASKHAAKQRGEAVGRVFALRSDWIYRDGCLYFARWARERHGCHRVAEAVQHPEWGREWLDELRRRGKATTSIKTYLSGVAKACAIVAPERRPAWTGVISLAGRRTAPPPRGYGADAERLIGNIFRAHPEAAAVLALSLETGARLGELVRTQRAGDHHLTRDRLLGDNLVLLVGKGGLERIQPVSDGTYAQLLLRATVTGDGEPLFGVTDRDVQRALLAACRRLGVRAAGPHGFRYDFAARLHARLVGDGWPAEEADREVSRQLGHRRPAITHHYLRTVP